MEVDLFLIAISYQLSAISHQLDGCDRRVVLEEDRAPSKDEAQADS
jgi:hypothetical protein